MPQSYYSFYCHIIFSSKNRKNLITPEIQLPLYKYIHGIIKNEKGKLMERGGTENHVHILMSFPPDKSAVDFVRTVKTNSSKWLRKDLSLNFFGWQNGYGLFSVRYSELKRVKNYILNQAAHHKKMSFKEEFILFFKKNCISCDEKYIFE